MSALRCTLALLAAAAGLACSAADDAEEWDASGVVRGVRADEAQVSIEHGDIDGLMPAMTMSFDVSDPRMLEGLEAGQYVEFRLRRTPRSFEIVRIDAPEGGAGRSGSRMDPLARADDPAPDFELVDQDGRPLSLRALRGSPVLLHFLFTACPGPCPIQTGIHADVRRALSPDDRARVRFVSITLDPATDAPEVLRDYAAVRKIDTDGWSFLTGEETEVAAVVKSYGVGTIRQPNGEIDHTVAAFLIDGEGQIVRRYLGLNTDPAEIRADIEALL